MKNIRRLILALSSFIGIWVLVSFAGAMFDSGNAALWSSSLMWALLSSLIVMPALVMVNHASTQASKEAAAQQQAAQTAEPEPFIEEDADETRTLWPDPEQETVQSEPDTAEQSEHVHA